MNICKQFECSTCETVIDCRIGMSNREVQPFQFACPNCHEIISFTIGSQDGELKGAVDNVEFEWPFDGSHPFVDLHLDFPVSFGDYQMGSTAFMKASVELKDQLPHLALRLHRLNEFYPEQGNLQSLITQYKRGDVKTFTKICGSIPGADVKSDKKEDVLAALYSATSILSSPFTIHEHNQELSQGMPELMHSLDDEQRTNFMAFLDMLAQKQFLKHLHYDCLSVYPKMLGLDLPLRPALYYDYVRTDSLGSIPARVSTADFESCNNFYKDLAEIFSRQLVLLAGINNILKRKDCHRFGDAVRLNKKGGEVKDFASLDGYANVDLGRKLNAIDDSFYRIDAEAIDHKLRNGIAHFKYNYDRASQRITYYPAKEGMSREKSYSLYFIEFMRKILLLFREVHNLNHIIKSLLYFNVLILKRDPYGEAS